MQDKERLSQLAQLAAIESDSEKLIALYQEIKKMLNRRADETVEPLDKRGGQAP
jgi:hypothetical protein